MLIVKCHRNADCMTCDSGNQHENMYIYSTDNGGPVGINFMFVSRETGERVYRNETALSSIQWVE